jgi:hypothetical protein
MNEMSDVSANKIETLDYQIRTFQYILSWGLFLNSSQIPL